MAGVVARRRPLWAATTSPTALISRFNHKPVAMDVNVVFLIISSMIITGILNTIWATITIVNTVCAKIIGTIITLNTCTRTTKINHNKVQLQSRHGRRIIRILRLCGRVAVNTMTTIIRTLPHQPPRGLPFLQLLDPQVNIF